MFCQIQSVPLYSLSFVEKFLVLSTSSPHHFDHLLTIKLMKMMRGRGRRRGLNREQEREGNRERERETNDGEQERLGYGWGARSVARYSGGRGGCAIPVENFRGGGVLFRIVLLGGVCYSGYNPPISYLYIFSQLDFVYWSS